MLNIVHLHGAATKPPGDVILCDVAREDASVILGDLKELEIPRVGSIAVEHIDISMSDAADEVEKAAPGLPSDAVVWEEVEQRTSENTELSVSFVAFMVLAMQIGAVGLLLDQPILIVGAMVVGPEFGPLAGLSVALVEKRADFARTGFISDPDFFSFFVGFVAGVAGILSLTSAKSGALIGVLISVVTIPAASNIGVAAAYGNWEEMGGAAGQLGLNLAAIVLAGVLTLYLQRRDYVSRRRRHLREPQRASAGLPVGKSARAARKKA